MALHKGENQYIYGLHDRGGEDLMLEGSDETGWTAKGWVLVTEEIGAEPKQLGGGNYSDLEENGLGVIVRLNQSYGPNGTIPREERYPDFAQRCANYVAGSQGAHIWIIGNEMNLEREQPRQDDNSNQAEPITPRRYAKCYKLCRQKIKAVPGHKDDLVVVGAIGPWNVQTPYDADTDGAYPANENGDFIRYFHDMLAAIGPENCDAIAIHAYSHGYAPQIVFDTAKMDPPFQNYHYNFFTYKDQMNAIPKNMRHLPVYLTEMNGDREGQGGPTWPFGNNGWIKNAYKEINAWNQSGRQQIRCGILFRWMKDPHGWTIDGKPGVQRDFTEAIAKNYKWDPEAGKMETKETPTKPGYRARYLTHNTPTRISAGQNVDVTLTVQNAGSYRWVQGGDKPFHLGFQWWDGQGNQVSLPSHLDFRAELPRDILPDGTVELRARLHAPDTPGAYQLRWDMVHELVTWFSTQGDTGLVIPITVTEVTTRPKEPSSGKTPKKPVTIDAIDKTNSLAQHAVKHYPMRTHSDINRIILHHTVTKPTITVERIAGFQVKERDLPGIAYHFCVTDGGQVYQTQYLETVSAHAGVNSDDSVGVCLIGDFTNSPPPVAQLSATATLLAQLALHLGLTTKQIFGFSEIVVTGSPGATWTEWKKPLLASVQELMDKGQPTQPKVTPTGKTIEHYLLLWHKSADNWALWDLQGALGYIGRFKPTVGFSVEQAKSAKYVTIVGGTAGVPGSAEETLRAAGCKVERLDGKSETETRHMLEELVKQGKRFRSLK